MIPAPTGGERLLLPVPRDSRSRQSRSRHSRGMNGGRPSRSRGTPTVSRGILPLPLQCKTLGSTVSSPLGSRVEPRPKTNLVHSRAGRKPLVAIILSILKYTFTVQRSKFSTCRNTVPFSLIRSTMTASVRRPKGGADNKS